MKTIDELKAIALTLLIMGLVIGLICCFIAWPLTTLIIFCGVIVFLILHRHIREIFK